MSLGANATARQESVAPLALLVLVLIFPWLPFVPSSLLGKANIAANYSLIAISLVVLTGWVGQVSLGQGALVGVGAYMTGLALGALKIPLPFNLLAGLAAGAAIAALLGVVALRVRGLYLAVATLIFVWTADVFLFQQEWLTRFSSVEVPSLGTPGTIPYLNFTSRRTFYYVAWALVALAVFAASNLRDRKIGRAFFAVRGSEMAAASLGIDVVRTKLLAFAVSGGIAGLAGGLTLISAQVVTIEQFGLKASLFYLAIAVVGGLSSLQGAVAAALLFAGLEEVFFRVPTVGDYLELVSAALLAVVLLAYPGGLAALGPVLWAKVRRWALTLARHPGREGTLLPQPLSQAVGYLSRQFVRAAARSPATKGAESGKSTAARPPSIYRRASDYLVRPLASLAASASARRKARVRVTPLEFQIADRRAPYPAVSIHALADQVRDPEPGEQSRPNWEMKDFESERMEPGQRESRRPLVEADSVSVRFGGLIAVDSFSLTVREGEIVGLIGPNGAGKTTLFNAIAGFVAPTSGQVRLYETDVTSLPVYLRSRLGVARTFQVIQLFPQLTVFDNLLVATFIQDTSGLFGSMFLTNRSLHEERRARERVRKVISLLGLEEIADRGVGGLPFGILRMVEIGRSLVTGARVLMLDEPASGLDDMETARLAKLVQFIRSLGVTILLIEHDVQMVTGVSDYMYVIDQGKFIGEGPPEKIQRDPAVIAAYLGEPVGDESISEPVKAGTS